MTNGKQTLFLDQFGQPVWAKTVKELIEQVGGSKASKMYTDKKDGSTVHCGYIVANRWFTAFQPLEVAA